MSIPYLLHVVMAYLVSALHDSSLPVRGRLKVAWHLWRQGELLSTERNALMLKWVCQELCLAYNKKNRAPPPHVIRGHLWSFLCTVLGAMVQEEFQQDLVVLSSHLFQVS